MFTLLIAGLVLVLVGALIGYFVRGHLAAIEKVETNTLHAVDAAFQRIESKLGLLHAKVDAAPLLVSGVSETPTAATPQTPAAS